MLKFGYSLSETSKTNSKQGSPFLMVQTTQHQNMEPDLSSSLKKVN